MKILCQYIHSKYEYFENKHCIFWSKHGCFKAFLDILNTKRLISPELKAQILAAVFSQKVIMCI